jgi:hypothetical protein
VSGSGLWLTKPTLDKIRADEWKAARDEQRQARVRAMEDEHARLTEIADPIVASVLRLHQPVTDWSSWGHCDGCESGGYEAEAPGWPCDTYTLIAEQLVPGWEGP